MADSLGVGELDDLRGDPSVVRLCDEPLVGKSIAAVCVRQAIPLQAEANRTVGSSEVVSALPDRSDARRLIVCASGSLSAAISPH